MKSLLTKKIVLLTVIAALPCAGIWAARRDQVVAAAPASASTQKSSALLSSMPTGGTGLTDKTITDMTRKLQQNDKLVAAWIALGDALMQKVRESADVSLYGMAEKAYLEALARDPKAAGAALGLAWVHGGRHSFDKSIEWANKTLEINPKEPAAFGIIGDAQVELGQYDGAFENYQKMLDLKPNLSSYSRGAHLLFVTGDVRKATALMLRAIQTGAPHAENTAWCRAQLAQMFLATGNLKAAGQVAEDAAKRNPENYHVQAALGKVHAAKKEYPAAIAALKSSVAAAPQIDTLLLLGDLLAITGKKDEAETQYAQIEAIHKLHKQSGQSGDRLIAQYLADSGRDLPEALKLAEDEYRQFQNVQAADTLAWCLYKNGRYKEAGDMSMKALARKTPDAQIYFHAGMIAAKLGDRAMAQKRLYQALSLNPNFHPVGAKVAADTLKELGTRTASL